MSKYYPIEGPHYNFFVSKRIDPKPITESESDYMNYFGDDAEHLKEFEQKKLNAKDVLIQEIDKVLFETKQNVVSDSCYIKAKARGQKTFTLVEQDFSSPVIICEWIKYGMANNVPAEKLRQALEDALAMRDSKTAKKVPD